ncbi:protease inhibitor I9 family protein [Micromonospora tulbaghiae]
MEDSEDFLVWLRDEPTASPASDSPSTRLSVPATAVYRTWARGFGARLTTAQATSLAADPAVLDVVPDEPGRPAPYRRTTSSDRVADSYLVMLLPGTDPTTVVSELGVEPTGLYRISFSGFAARLTDRQLHRVRHSPLVTWVMDDITAGP